MTKYKNSQFIYGPVPSRRLGLSLGVDLVTDNTCSYDCVYCQLGRTKTKTIDRKPYLPVEPILAELAEKISSGIAADFITLAGSGEPTLNSGTGLLIREIKKHTSIPVAVITNASLLHDRQVRKDLAAADLILPSLDAHNQDDFEKINRPHHGISFENMLKGLIDFSISFRGEIWLEILILKGINDTGEDALKFKELIGQIKPLKIQLNTAVRPAAEQSARHVTRESLDMFCRIIGSGAEVIASFKRTETADMKLGLEEEIMNLLARRPCTVDDISAGLQSRRTEVLKSIDILVSEKKVEEADENGSVYYKLIS